VLGAPLALIGRGSAALRSIHDADADSLALSTIDLSRCLFRGSHGLQEMTIDSTVSLARAPRLRARRRCVLDEFAWRARHSKWRARDWLLEGTALELPSPAHRVKPPVVLPDVTAAEVARVYRSLRRALESGANEPGASDFYYGEMEMRRHDHSASRAERLIVTAYWLVAGYGLRATRAFLSLALLVVVGGIGFDTVGLEGPDQSRTQDVLTSLESAIPGVQTTGQLTSSGRAIDLVLTILGPVLLALAALALRNRVKR
jgi:hypothetical protein